MKLKIVLQKAYGRKYMWAYYVRENNKCIISGGVYYSSFSSYQSAETQIKRELKNRLKGVNIEELFNNAEVQY